LLFENQY